MKKISLCCFLILVSVIVLPSEPVLSAHQSAIFREIHSGRVLYEKNADKILPMASTTKIMTCILAIENADSEEIVSVSEYAASTEGSSMQLEAGDSLELKDLLFGLMFCSGNDAAVAVAEHISGDCESFCMLMNEKAVELGCKNTHFANPHGLDEKNHYSTARDMLRIADYAMKNSFFREIVSSKSATVIKNGKESVYFNRNRFLQMQKYAIGIKNGYTELANRCFISGVEKDGMEIHGAVLFTENMYNDSLKITSELLEKYTMKTVLQKGTFLKKIPVLGSSEQYVQIILPEDIRIPLTEDEQENLSIRYEFIQKLAVPVDYHQKVGKITVLNGNDEIYTEDIYTQESFMHAVSAYDKLIRHFSYLLSRLFQ